MKQLKSTAQDLQAIVERSLLARDLAEPLASFDEEQAASAVRSFMEAPDKDYDVVGVRQDGFVVGYVCKSDLLDVADDENIGEHMRKFEGSTILESHGIKGVTERLRELHPSPVFVVGRCDHVWGIITRGDLQKAPVRMYLFGLVTTLEMQLLRLVRRYRPNDTWRCCLNDNRLKEAQKRFDDLRSRNEHIYLADCLTFADKRDIVKKTDDLRSCLGFQSKNKAESTLKELEELRDNLAHGHDILARQWPSLVDLVQSAESILERCESDEDE